VDAHMSGAPLWAPVGPRRFVEVLDTSGARSLP